MTYKRVAPVCQRQPSFLFDGNVRGNGWKLMTTGGAAKSDKKRLVLVLVQKLFTLRA